MKPFCTDSGRGYSRSLTGAWIETRSPKIHHLLPAVAPLRGRGLKLLNWRLASSPEKVAPLRGRGLKRYGALSRKLLREPFRHPLARRRKSNVRRHRRTVHLQRKHGFIKNSGGKSAQNSCFGSPRAHSGIPIPSNWVFSGFSGA